MISAMRTRLAAMLLAINVLAIITLAIIILPAPALLADQTDARLPALFTELRTTTEAEKAKIVAAEIWQIWSEHSDNDRVSESLKMGIAQMEAGRLRQAEQIFTTIIDTDPDFAEAWNKRATVRFLRGDDAGSRSDIVRVIELEPRHFGALSGLGMIHMRAGDLQAALQAFEAALRVNPHLDQAVDLTARLRKRLRGQTL